MSTDTNAEATERLLHLCLRADVDRGALEKARSLAAGAVSWGGFSDAVTAERVGPLVHHVACGRGVLPPELEEAVQDQYHQAARRNLILRYELRGALRRLASAGVDVIVLKGAALAETIYRRIGLRPMRDLDLLIRYEQLGPAVRALEEAGFHPAKIGTRPGAATELDNGFVLLKRSLVPVPVGLHWSLFDSPYYQTTLDMTWFWSSSRRFELEGCSGRMLGPEAQLLHLCGNLRLHHAGEGALLRLHDIARVLHREGDDVDWNELLDRARQCDLVLPVREVLYRVRQDWGAPVPETVIERLNATDPSPQEKWVVSRLTAGKRSVLQRFSSDLASMPTWGQRLRFVWVNVFPSRAYMRQRYAVRSALLLPLYYPYRWIRGLLRAL